MHNEFENMTNPNQSTQNGYIENTADGMPAGLADMSEAELDELEQPPEEESEAEE